VLAYHILLGPMSDYRTFVCELADQARSRFQFRTQEAQTPSGRREGLANHFATFLRTLMHSNQLDRLLVAVDGLDEIPEPPVDGAAITDFLPDVDALPRGCLILLTRRESVRPRVAERLKQLQQAAPAGFRRQNLRTDDPVYLALVRNYVSETLPAGCRASEAIEEVLRRAHGTFLYARHLAHALASGALPAGAHLPEGGDFYRAYLDRLRDQAGASLFGEVYLPLLLLLAAARQPVTAAQLIRWGVPRDRLAFALLDLRDFLRSERALLVLSGPAADTTYQIAHPALLRFLGHDERLSPALRQAHARIARSALTRHTGHWTDADPDDPADLYDLRHVLTHLRLGEMEGQTLEVLVEGGYGDRCCEVGIRAHDRARHRLALEMFEADAEVYQRRAGQIQSPEEAAKLAGLLMNQGNALAGLRRDVEARGLYDQALTLLRRAATGGRDELWQARLSLLLMNRGETLSHLGQDDQAFRDFDEALTLRLGLAGKSGEVPGIDIAGAHLNRGMALSGLGRLREALADYDQALSIFTRLRQQGDQSPRLRRALATAHMNRGGLLRRLGCLEEAANALEHATSGFQQLVSQEGRQELGNRLAATLINTGAVHEDQGQYARAAEAYQQALVLLRRLVIEDRQEGLLGDLGDCLVRQGQALTLLGRWDEARAHFEEARPILEGILERQGGPEPAYSLARLVQRLADLPGGEAGNAVALHRRAVELLRAVTRTQEGAESHKALAMALVNCGLACGGGGRSRLALSYLRRGTRLYRRLVQADGRDDLRHLWALACMNFGNTLADQGSLAGASREYRRAVRILERLVERERRADLRPELAVALLNYGSDLHGRGNVRRAEAAFARAVVLYRSLPGGTSPTHRTAEMATTLVNHGVTLRALGRAEEALASFRDGVAHWEAARAANLRVNFQSFRDGLANCADLFWERGDRAQAAQAILRGLDLAGPDGWDWLLALARFQSRLQGLSPAELERLFTEVPDATERLQSLRSHALETGEEAN
jgi:tetratricopeptide (TPR) repeat protein